MSALALVCFLATANPQDGPVRMVTVKAKVLQFRESEIPEELDDAALRKLVESSKPESSKEFQLSTLDQRQARIKIGNEVAIIGGYVTTGRGGSQPTYERVAVGSSLIVTPMVQKSHIILEASIEVSSIVESPKPAKETEVTKFAPSERALMSLESTFALEPGKPLFLHVRDQNPKTNRHYVIVVTATSKTFE